jgi:hypothetical protein
VGTKEILLMTETTLASLAGVVLSLAFSYIPGLTEWFAKLTANNKRLIMLAALLAVALGLFGASCAGFSAQVACDMTDAKSMLSLFVSAAIANQTAYMLTPSKVV